MAKVYSREEVKDAIRAELRGSYHRRARPDERAYMTAYQVLSLLPEDLRAQLVVTDGPSGRNVNSYHSAAKGVAKMLVEMSQVGEVEIAVLDTRRVTLHVEGQGPIEPGDQYACGIYRWIDKTV